MLYHSRMKHKQGTARDQSSFSSFEDQISRDIPVRFIDVFSGKIGLEKIGFSVKTLQKEGRPSFESSLFVQLYLYCNLNGLRIIRKLEKECERNIELHWLLHGMIPNYHSISDFRKDEPQALKKLFKLFVSFLKAADLITGETIAIDGTKSRAHNSKKDNFSLKRMIGTLNASTRKWRNTCLFWRVPMCRMNKWKGPKSWTKSLLWRNEELNMSCSKNACKKVANPNQHHWSGCQRFAGARSGRWGEF